MTFPFLAHAARGIRVVEAPLAELAEHIDANTSLVALAAVQSADGAVAPLDADPAVAFDLLARIRSDFVSRHPGATLLSAGMSGDLEQAITAGATHVRVGSAVLGPRPTIK